MRFQSSTWSLHCLRLTLKFETMGFPEVNYLKARLRSLPHPNSPTVNRYQRVAFSILAWLAEVGENLSPQQWSPLAAMTVSENNPLSPTVDRSTQVYSRTTPRF